MQMYVKKARDCDAPTGRPLDGSRVDTGSDSDVRAGVGFGAKAARGSLGTVHQSMRVSLRPPHGPQTRTTSNVFHNTVAALRYRCGILLRSSVVCLSVCLLACRSVGLSVCHSREMCKKRLNRSRCRLARGLSWARGSMYYR